MKGVEETYHVDNFVTYGPETESQNLGDTDYARWVLMHYRLPAVMWSAFRKFMVNDEFLFCTYREKRYRCIGASRLGDVWLTSNFNSDTGYELRVGVSDCAMWSQNP